jgi:molybdate transport system substrate-binding protein
VTRSTNKRVAALLICLGLWSPPPAAADDIVVAAASDLSFAIREIIADFEANTSHTVRLSLGSSGNFFAQIQNGAPFDIYLSADINYPEQLAVSGLTEPGSLFSYAFGKIVVWARNESSTDLTSLGMRALLEETGRISIANPRHAPYGRAARSALEYYDLWESVSPRLVLAENVAQAAQFAESGAAAMAIIALSLASSDPLRDAGHFWEIPPQAHPALAQGGVILPHARNTGRLTAARSFAAWMQSDRARLILERYGFSLPSN